MGGSQVVLDHSLEDVILTSGVIVFKVRILFGEDLLEDDRVAVDVAIHGGDDVIVCFDHFRRCPELEERRLILVDLVRGLPDPGERVLLVVQVCVDLNILPVSNLGFFKRKRF